MPTYVPTAFDGVTIVSSTVKIVEIEETTRPIIRMGQLPNGAIFDADGSADADVGLGQVIATYSVTPASKGVVSLNTLVAALTGLEGKVGTLTGKAEAPGGALTKTCTARCISVVAQRMTVRENPPLHANYIQRQLVTMTWQKKSEWSS